MKPQIPESPSFFSQLGPILFLTTIFFLNFIGRIVFAPLMPTVENDLGLDHTQAGSLFLLISLGYFIALLCSGFISCRFTHRRTIIISVLSVGVVLVCTSFSNSLWSIRLSLFLLGLAAGIYLPSGITTLTSLVNVKHWGKAIAIHELAPNLGFMMAPLLSELFMIWFSWRAVILFLGAGAILTGIAFAFFGKGGEFLGETPNFGSIKTLFAEPAFWIMAVLFSFGICATLGIYAMLPLYLVTEHGLDRSWANTLVALSRISGVFMAFVAGWVSDRLGPKFTLSGVFLATGLMTMMIGSGWDRWIVIFVFLQPAMAVCFFPPGFAALASIGPPNARNIAVSLTVPAAFIFGAGAIPLGIGMMADGGFFDLGFVLTGGLILTGALLALFLRSPRQ